MKNYKTVLIAVLIGITLFSVFKYIVTLKQNQDLTYTVNEARKQISNLITDKEKLLTTIESQKQALGALTEENSGLKDKLNKVDAELAAAQQKVAELNAEAQTLRDDNAAMKTRLSSIKELKKAIREIKIQMRQTKVAVLKKADMDKLLDGNRGFLIRDGKSTYPSKIRIEVSPAQ